MDVRDLYRDVILDHNRSPRNFGRLEPADAEALGHNPLCGDSLSLTLRVAGDRLSEIRFNGQGCAISVASASMMSEAVSGKPLAEVEALYREVHALLTEPAHVPALPLGKLMALGGVREFPARVKCASLCWHTLQAALQRHAVGERPTVSTE
ncbi:MAG TPA: SUF system NifU family Fe-S cluster assembly protein [Steroidobacteraceae bacterium]|nr:SUF system NifU family Fe-S cluster assembly protein [Steroidobacteraceae bacterium]